MRSSTGMVGGRVDFDASLVELSGLRSMAVPDKRQPRSLRKQWKGAGRTPASFFLDAADCDSAKRCPSSYGSPRLRPPSPAVHGDTRRAARRRFPCPVYFRATVNTVVVLSVHGR